MPAVWERYRHYKNGHTYEIIALGKHSETLEDMVVYQGEYEYEEFGSRPVWIRPLSLFVEMVEDVPRFEKL